MRGSVQERGVVGNTTGMVCNLGAVREPFFAVLIYTAGHAL